METQKRNVGGDVGRDSGLRFGVPEKRCSCIRWRCGEIAARLAAPFFNYLRPERDCGHEQEVRDKSYCRWPKSWFRRCWPWGSRPTTDQNPYRNTYTYP